VEGKKLSLKKQKNTRIQSLEVQKEQNKRTKT
jgi:hypothetical protein